MTFSFATWTLACAATVFGLALPASAKEYIIGKPHVVGSLKITAVYLQPVTMAPARGTRAATQSDIHLEADIHATANNPNGLPRGAWVPYLVVRYVLTKGDGKARLAGTLIPMVAADGPHYGSNVKLMGPGKYTLTLTVLPPTASGQALARHVDKETGVAPWFEPITLRYDFIYAGTGKKSTY